MTKGVWFLGHEGEGIDDELISKECKQLSTPYLFPYTVMWSRLMWPLREAILMYALRQLS